MMFLTGDSKRYVTFIAYSVLVFVIVLKPVWGLKLNYSFSQSFDNSTNLLKIPDVLYNDKFENTINITSVNLKIDEQSNDLKSFIKYNVDYMDYGNNDLVNDLTRNNLEAELSWILSPGHYKWFFKDIYTQSRIEPSLLFNETNTQDVNQFITGPELEWKVNSSSIYLDSYIYDYNYSETKNDNKSIVTTLRWNKKISSGMDVFVKYSTKFLTYENEDLFNNYDQSSLVVGYAYKRNTNDLNISYGKIYVDSEDLSQDEFSDVQFNFRRQMSRFSILDLSYSSGISDQNDSIEDAGTVLSGVYEDRVSSVTYHRMSNRFGFDLKLTKREKLDKDKGYSDILEGSAVTLSSLLSPRSQIRLVYNDSKIVAESNLLNYEDNIYETRLEYSKSFNNKLSLRIYVSDLVSRSTDVFRQYKDERYGVALSFSR